MGDDTPREDYHEYFEEYDEGYQDGAYYDENGQEYFEEEYYDGGYQQGYGAQQYHGGAAAAGATGYQPQPAQPDPKQLKALRKEQKKLDPAYQMRKKQERKAMLKIGKSTAKGVAKLMKSCDVDDIDV